VRPITWRGARQGRHGTYCVWVWAVARVRAPWKQASEAPACAGGVGCAGAVRRPECCSAAAPRRHGRRLWRSATAAARTSSGPRPSTRTSTSRCVTAWASAGAAAAGGGTWRCAAAHKACAMWAWGQAAGPVACTALRVGPRWHCPLRSLWPAPHHPRCPAWPHLSYLPAPPSLQHHGYGQRVQQAGKRAGLWPAAPAPAAGVKDPQRTPFRERRAARLCFAACSSAAGQRMCPLLSPMTRLVRRGRVRALQAPLRQGQARAHHQG
jgi:hypothetical protein